MLLLRFEFHSATLLSVPNQPAFPPPPRPPPFFKSPSLEPAAAQGRSQLVRLWDDAGPQPTLTSAGPDVFLGEERKQPLGQDLKHSPTTKITSRQKLLKPRVENPLWEERG